MDTISMISHIFLPNVLILFFLFISPVDPFHALNSLLSHSTYYFMFYKSALLWPQIFLVNLISAATIPDFVLALIHI